VHRYADGLLLDGKTPYVVQFGARLNRVAVVELSPDYLSGVIARTSLNRSRPTPRSGCPASFASLDSSARSAANEDTKAQSRRPNGGPRHARVSERQNSV